MIPSEGYDTSLKILSVCQYLLTLAYGEKSGNTSDGDTQLRWCPPSIAGEPVLPTPALMSAGWHGVGEGEAKPLDGSELKEGSQRIADASEPSRCADQIDQPHPPTSLVRA